MAKKTRGRTGGGYPIPFDPVHMGCMHYPERVYQGSRGVGRYLDPLWMDNFEFEATLIYEDYGRGRSAAYFFFKDEATGAIHSMFMRDFHDVIRRCTLDQGRVTSRWTFIKRGMNYGIQMVIDDPEEGE